MFNPNIPQLLFWEDFSVGFAPSVRKKSAVVEATSQFIHWLL
jgi:hypothetical protein